MSDSSTLWSLPSSTAIAVKETLDTGRAVFAKAELLQNNHLLTTTFELSPVAYVIFRPYKREVCAWCFKYDRGRHWKLRDRDTGTAFCSEACKHGWCGHWDESSLQAWISVESFIKSTASRHRTIDDQYSKDADTMTDAQNTWNQTESLGRAIVSARTTIKPSKDQRAILQTAVRLTPDPDILAYVLSGILSAYRVYKTTQAHQATATDRTDASALLPSLFYLTSDDEVFSDNPMTPSPLYDYTSTYLVLLTMLPLEILDFLSLGLITNLASRASHNAFSIRPEGLSDGEQSGEFLGWGVWPEASFFNHSCQPNVKKERQGRKWSFYVSPILDEGIQEGEQLCITYLGGDEKDLSVQERRKRLQEQWGFWCKCDRCQQESKHDA